MLSDEICNSNIRRTNMANKVKYGLKNVHYAIATIDTITGEATYATPVRIPGAVNLTAEPSGDTNDFFADDIKFASFAANAGYETTLEIALLPDTFRQDVLGEVLDEDIQYETTEASAVPFALLFEFNGDEHATKHVMYNCIASRTNLDGQTAESSIEVKTEELKMTCGSVYNAELAKNIVKGKCDVVESDAFKNWYTAVQQKTKVTG